MAAAPWLVAGCGPAVTPARDSRPTANVSAAADAGTLQTFVVAGHRVGLEVAATACTLLEGPPTEPQGKPPRRLELALRPPCYLLEWHTPHPLASAEDNCGCIPMGGPGEPMAWRFPDAGNVIVLVVIGDPVAESVWAKRPGARHLRCSSSTQGVLLRRDSVTLSERVRHPGFRCVESGEEVLPFWLFAHGE